tara:strand:+ start:1644 stop:1871 length:228 start_codon:yes stop_codon:yes gene_type:complete
MGNLIYTVYYTEKRKDNPSKYTEQKHLKNFDSYSEALKYCKYLKPVKTTDYYFNIKCFSKRNNIFMTMDKEQVLF